MNEVESIIRSGLESIGLGPVRLESALSGAELYGPVGLLNSLEIVQFIAALSESTKIDVGEFLQDAETGLGNIFSDVAILGHFLRSRFCVRLEA
jgi:hypothetical protein